ncbi:MAG: hypothetical protein KKC05_00120, partial [Nanoarchaeota archaeon]|nr:hypothetical protein [Nanoarchaeota archaeon]
TLFNISNYYMGILGDFPEKEFGSGVIERSGDRRLKPYIEEIRRLYGDDIAIEVFGSFWSSDNNDVDARVYRNEFSVDDYNILERSDVFYVDGIPLGPQVMPRDIGRKLRGYNLDAGIETENKRIVFGDIDLPILKEDDVKTLLMIQIGDYILRTREETYMEWIRENLLPGTTINKIRGRLKTPHLIYKWLKHFYDSIPEPPPKTDISRMGEADVLEEMIRVNVYYSQLAQRLKEPI